jgi:hypothetical protein
MNILDDIFRYGKIGTNISKKFCRKMACCGYENLVLKNNKYINFRNWLDEEKRLTRAPIFEISRLVFMKDLWEKMLKCVFSLISEKGKYQLDYCPNVQKESKYFTLALEKLVYTQNCYLIILIVIIQTAKHFHEKMGTSKIIVWLIFCQVGEW